MLARWQSPLLCPCSTAQLSALRANAGNAAECVPLTPNAGSGARGRWILRCEEQPWETSFCTSSLLHSWELVLCGNIVSSKGGVAGDLT